MNEVWKEIPDFENYMISNLGRVKSFKCNINKNGKILKPSINNGYYFVCLTNNNGKLVKKNIHRLISELFIPNPNNLPNVDHIDTNRLNNDLSNLRWASLSQNQCNRNKQVTKTSSKYKGVYWNKKMQKWRAQVSFEGKQYYLGCFTSEIEAALSYNQSALKFFKQFAKLNIIE